MEHHIQFSDKEKVLFLLDQRYLPEQEEFFACRKVADVIYALKEMVVRGAPAIGVTAAYGCFLTLREVEGSDWEKELSRKLDQLADARPTAVNLSWAVERMRRIWADMGKPTHDELEAKWLQEAVSIHKQDIETNRRMGRYGAELLSDGDRIMTHCNAGALATAGCGTALGVIRMAVEQGKRIEVVANETRPFLQGARLTSYELHRESIPVRVACDNAAALLMARGLVDKVVVGADRIAANGDVANKIGTYGLALLAEAHKIPFYVAAPLSTIDMHTPSGQDIPIEERTPREVTCFGGARIVPAGVGVFNFAFDITPSRLVTAIITEKGIFTPPYKESIAAGKKNDHE